MKMKMPVVVGFLLSEKVEGCDGCVCDSNNEKERNHYRNDSRSPSSDSLSTTAQTIATRTASTALVAETGQEGKSKNGGDGIVNWLWPIVLAIIAAVIIIVAVFFYRVRKVGARAEDSIQMSSFKLNEIGASSPTEVEIDPSSLYQEVNRNYLVSAREGVMNPVYEEKNTAGDKVVDHSAVGKLHGQKAMDIERATLADVTYENKNTDGRYDRYGDDRSSLANSTYRGTGVNVSSDV